MYAYKAITIYFGLPGEKDIMLADILACIPSGERREWALLHITATGVPGSLDALSVQAEAEIRGIVYGWEALRELQGRFGEVSEMMVCGGDRVGHLRRALPFEELLGPAEYVIELLDGGIWVVHTGNEQAIGNIRDRFSRVEVEEI